MSEIVVLGGDGFCGWPTALHLANNPENNVSIVDNLSRRRIADELGAQSLTPIVSITERLNAWEEIAGSEKAISFEDMDISSEDEYGDLCDLIEELQPDTIVHFAEQRAAPYSMKTPATGRYTVRNNVMGTANLLSAINETGVDSHIVHLGTMGVYGYGWTGTAPIPEGYVPVKIPTPDGELDREILHPANPGSLYHMTKVLDQTMLGFDAKNFENRITDLHQGIVWGTQTPQTSLDERLINRFDYDGDYGTVLNRFLMEAAIGHPLTVHGSGGQTRAFIHIRDTVRCVELAAQNPPERGERVTINNQVTESHRVRDLAKMVSDMTGVEIAFQENPRKEAAENELNVANDNFLALGLSPTKLSEGLMEEVKDIAEKYKDRANRDKIISTSLWVKPKSK